MSGTSIYLRPELQSRLDAQVERNKKNPRTSTQKEREKAAAMAQQHGQKVANAYLTSLQPPCTRSSVIEAALEAYLAKEA